MKRIIFLVAIGLFFGCSAMSVHEKTLEGGIKQVYTNAPCADDYACPILVTLEKTSAMEENEAILTPEIRVREEKSSGGFFGSLMADVLKGDVQKHYTFADNSLHINIDGEEVLLYSEDDETIHESYENMDGSKSYNSYKRYMITLDTIERMLSPARVVLRIDLENNEHIVSKVTKLGGQPSFKAFLEKVREAF